MTHKDLNGNYQLATFDTIISHDGNLVVQGKLHKWVDDHGGFEFSSPGWGRNVYCNTDYWKILWNQLPGTPIGRITVIKE